jgi:hypothetical protein
MRLHGQVEGVVSFHHQKPSQSTHWFSISEKEVPTKQCLNNAMFLLPGVSGWGDDS